MTPGRSDRAVPAPPIAQAAWCLFDWANSPFPTVISTFLFANYFVRAVASDPETGAGLWALAHGIAGVAVAMLSPVLGAFADRGGARKPWLAGMVVVMAVATALLWYVRPDPADVLLGMVLIVVATAAFELSMVFYNAMLPDLTTEDRIGRLSGWGWGLGYLGGLVALVVALLVFVQVETPPFGLDKDAAEHVRAASLLVAVWLAVFCIPFFVIVPDRPATGLPAARIVREGLAQLGRTLRHWRDHRPIMRFLIAFMLYSNGINTLFAMGAVYAGVKFGMDFDEIIIFGIALNITAGAGAIAFGWIDDRIGAKPTVVMALAAIGMIGAAVLLVDSVAWFWGLALALSVFFGPAQAASRSLMAHMAPIETRVEMFGLYGLAGRVTSFAGTLVVSWVTLATGSFQIGMSTVLLFIVAGLALLFTVQARRVAEPVAAGRGGGR